MRTELQAEIEATEKRLEELKAKQSQTATSYVNSYGETVSVFQSKLETSDDIVIHTGYTAICIQSTDINDLIRILVNYKNLNEL